MGVSCGFFSTCQRQTVHQHTYFSWLPAQTHVGYDWTKAHVLISFTIMSWVCQNSASYHNTMSRRILTIHLLIHVSFCTLSFLVLFLLCFYILGKQSRHVCTTDITNTNMHKLEELIPTFLFFIGSSSQNLFTLTVHMINFHCFAFNHFSEANPNFSPRFWGIKRAELETFTLN